jgi:hypothetical protein
LIALWNMVSTNHGINLLFIDDDRMIIGL